MNHHCHAFRIAVLIGCWPLTLAAQQAPATRPAGPVVFGLDLTSIPYETDPWKVADLYAPNPTDTTRLSTRDEIFPMPLRETDTRPAPDAELLWLQYPYTLDHFYITWTINRPDSPRRFYGPIAGDPFEVLGLEELMHHRMVERYTPDDVHRIRLMLRSGNQALGSRALQIIIRLLDAPMSLSSRTTYTRELRRYLEPESEKLTNLGLVEELAQVTARLDLADREQEAMTIELALEDYKPAGAMQPAPPRDIPESAWGQPVNGLRLAVLPVTSALTLGSSTEMRLIVENVSKQNIRFAERALFMSALPKLEDQQGQAIEVRRIRRTGRSLVNRFLIQPGERVIVALPRFGFGTSTASVDGLATVAPGTYSISYSFTFPNGRSYSRLPDGGQYQSYPAKGEWEGTLSSGSMTITLVPAAEGQ